MTCIGTGRPGGWVGTPDDTGTCSLPTHYTNLSRMDVASVLMRVGTTDSVLSMPSVYLIVYPVESISNSQYPSPQPPLYGLYPPQATVTLTLSGRVPHFGCDPAVEIDMRIGHILYKGQPQRFLYQ